MGPGMGAGPRAELALDYEAFIGRALPASLHHQLRGTCLPLGERAQVLRRATQLVQRHIAAGQLLQGTPTDQCCSLLPLGGHLCQGLRARPYFRAQKEMALQLPDLAVHCQEIWLMRLCAPAWLRPASGEHFLISYFPHPPRGVHALPPYVWPPRRPPA